MISLDSVRIVPYSSNSAAYNMAADEFILNSPGSTLRLYAWEKPTLSFGRFRQGLEEIDENVCKERGIQKVKRLTGGKTVLHHIELTYSFASDIGLFSESVLDTYKILCYPLLDFFRKFGVSAEMNPEKSPAQASSICFKEVSSYEVTLKKRKIIGSAQCRRKNRFLQHGAILLGIDWDLWKEIWRIPRQERGLEKRIACLNDALTVMPTMDELVSAFEESFCSCFQCAPQRRAFNPEEERSIGILSDKYIWRESQ